MTPIGNLSHYDGLRDFALERRFAAGMHPGVSYVVEVDRDCCTSNSDGLAAIQIPEYYNLNRSISAIDSPYNLTVNGVWALPMGKGRALEPSQGRFPGWWADGRPTAYSSVVAGSPFMSLRPATSLNAPGSAQRADQIKPEVAILGRAGRGESYFDPLAYRPVTDARFGTAGFSSLRGPGIFNLDLGLFRQFRITERWQAAVPRGGFQFHQYRPTSGIREPTFLICS